MSFRSSGAEAPRDSDRKVQCNIQVLTRIDGVAAAGGDLICPLASRTRTLCIGSVRIARHGCVSATHAGKPLLRSPDHRPEFAA
jgi:hypothetical protein